MGAELHNWRDQMASAMAWWRDAGVDTLVDEAPRDWLAAPVSAPVAARAAPIATTPGLPETLEAFLAWRMGADAPDARWSPVRASFEGDPAAPLMIVTDMPERDAPERVLGGKAGLLFDRILAAIGRERGNVYLASLCIARSPQGAIPPGEEARFAAIAQHLIGLIAPPRLLLLGAVGRALLGTEPSRASAGLRPVNHARGTSEAVATLHPRLLLERPAMKGQAWADLQNLIGEPK